MLAFVFYSSLDPCLPLSNITQASDTGTLTQGAIVCHRSVVSAVKAWLQTRASSSDVEGGNSSFLSLTCDKAPQSALQYHSTCLSNTVDKMNSLWRSVQRWSPIVNMTFLIEFIGVTLVHKTTKIQGYNSTNHHLHTVLCTHHPSKVSFYLQSPHFSYLHLTLPLPSDYHHTDVCVYVLYICFYNPFTSFHQVLQPPPLWHLSVWSMYPCLCFYFVHQIPHISETTWYCICLSLTGLFHLV